MVFTKQKYFFLFTAIFSFLLSVSSCSRGRRDNISNINPSSQNNQDQEDNELEIDWGDTFKLAITVPKKVIKGVPFKATVVISNIAGIPKPYKGTLAFSTNDASPLVKMPAPMPIDVPASSRSIVMTFETQFTLGTVTSNTRAITITVDDSVLDLSGSIPVIVEGGNDEITGTGNGNDNIDKKLSFSVEGALEKYGRLYYEDKFFKVKLPRALTSNTTFSISTSQVGGSIPGTDFTANPYLITVPAGKDFFEVEVPKIIDRVHEIDRPAVTFNINIAQDAFYTLTQPIHLEAGPVALKNTKAIATGGNHTCALLAPNGAVKCWGANYYGQLGNGDNSNTNAPGIAAITSGATAIATGGFHTCALLENGAVKCWGSGNDGQLGNGDYSNTNAPGIAAITSGATAIAAGRYHTCALLANGAVKCWGSGNDGQLGNGDYSNTNAPGIAAITSGATAIAAGNSYTCALLENGAVKCWGSGYNGQLGNGDDNNTNAPGIAAITSGATAIATGGYHTCALLADGAVKCWGNGYSGQLGNGSNGMGSYTNTPGIAAIASGATAITAGYSHTCALLAHGVVKCWGSGYSGQLGNGMASYTNTPGIAAITSVATAIAAGDSHTCALLADGAVKCWGSGDQGQLGNGSYTYTNAPPRIAAITSGATAIAAGESHTCALLAGGAVKCWGSGGSGQLGNGDYSNTNTPGIAAITSGATAIAAGNSYTCALLTDGAVKCWGVGNNWQLGNGDDSNTNAPGIAAITSGATAIATGNSHTCALLAPNGAVKCWGDNYDGQLGNGDYSNTNAPGIAAITSSATAITAGYSHTCALLAPNGAVKCWGDNYDGQLGNGDYSKTNAPGIAAITSGATAIAAGDFHTCALLADGAVKCWGSGNQGQLGNGDYSKTNAPGIAAITSGATAIAAGRSYTCALLAPNGAVKCWGTNYSGQLGNGDYSKTNAPGIAAITSGATAIAAGSSHTCALLADGAVKCWGSGNQGQLGNGPKLIGWLPTFVTPVTLSPAPGNR